MPYANKADYMKWRQENHDKIRAYKRKSKRCPACNKGITVRNDRKSPFRVCPHCGTKIRVSKTLGSNPNHDNVGGIRLKVVC